MVQWAKELVAKSDNMSSITGTHKIVGKNLIPKALL